MTDHANDLSSAAASPELEQALIRERIDYLYKNTDFPLTLFRNLSAYAIVAADFDGNVIAFNEGGRLAFGYPPEEVIGRQRIDLFFPGEFIEAGKLQEAVSTVISTGQFSYDGEMLRNGGERFPVHAILTLTKDIGGKMVGLILIAEDITERRRAEEELRGYAAQLEAANAELDAFSYSVSHDLRTPLRAIDGFSRILLEDYQERLDDEGRRLLNVVRDNTRKMGQLIDDILSFSRMGRQEMALSEVDMGALARSVFDELKAAAGHPFEVKSGALPPALADPAMMRRVWTNLIDNAIKFTRPRAAAVIELGGALDGREIVYYVKDNGVGFDMQYVDKLFGVFQRLHGVGEFEGTGIGLAIVKRIVARHGGRVWAEGRVNEGATFYFALPAKEAGHD